MSDEQLQEFVGRFISDVERGTQTQSTNISQYDPKAKEEPKFTQDRGPETFMIRTIEAERNTRAGPGVPQKGFRNILNKEIRE